MLKEREIRVLVATDIAARGIDVEELSHVINYDLPNVPETYVHRIGRTGRAGASGLAISFCDHEEKEFLRDIQKLIKKNVPVIAEHPFKPGSPIAKEPVMAQAPVIAKTQAGPKPLQQHNRNRNNNHQQTRREANNTNGNRNQRPQQQRNMAVQGNANTVQKKLVVQKPALNGQQLQQQPVQQKQALVQQGNKPENQNKPQPAQQKNAALPKQQLQQTNEKQTKSLYIPSKQQAANTELNQQTSSFKLKNRFGDAEDEAERW